MDDLATYTSYAVGDLSKSFAVYPHPFKKDVNIVSAETSYFSETYEKFKNQHPLKKIKTVLLHCYSFDEKMNLDTIFSDIFYFHTEFILISFLVKNGFEVIYKVHPETVSALSEYKKIFSHISNLFHGKVHISYERLQEITHLADAFLMYYTTATSFYWFLCLQKPLVLIDSDTFVRRHSDKALELIGKRCSFIPFCYDEKNMLRWDEGVLLRSLTHPKEPDFEFAKRYLFT